MKEGERSHVTIVEREAQTIGLGHDRIGVSSRNGRRLVTATKDGGMRTACPQQGQGNVGQETTVTIAPLVLVAVGTDDDQRG